MPEVTFSDLKVLDVEPGQVVVLWVPEDWPRDQMEAAAREFTAMFPHNPVLVLPEGCSLEVRDREAISG